MSERRTTERLLADADERLRATERLPERLGEIRGWAHNGDENVRVTVDVHGGLKELRLDESALALGVDELGAQIVELAHRAQRAALAEGVNVLGDVLGDAAALDMMRSAGLADEIGPDPEVIPYTPGVDPNAHRWRVIPPGE
ncbi:YbaB/EbfC family nucleoid-associated protein [Amycolatopsis cynarae]|uniref:YbaB/EbfC family nucleoid-associated protein n=1 Tax=Amycolatopsis cynarae TaxID=2995223 RepID=A0ABY7B209_9PSEU|nr:YbaB/EbfC family nucleoid-associated protein [Amycolatopsis sp. HUAS 11-8]WAL66332.1 YbaB/EbfC family nucleoid-associated protein [Amycolatopsis sp. HUAS 11-8]